MKYLYDYSIVASTETSAMKCQCPECDAEFTSEMNCSKCTCPECGNQGCDPMEMEDDDDMEDSSWQEFISIHSPTSTLSPYKIIEEQPIVAKEVTRWCVRSSVSGNRIACCPSRDEALAILERIEEFRSMKSGIEQAKQHCECMACGALFYTNTRCDLSTCPVCNEQDDIEELSGVL